MELHAIGIDLGKTVFHLVGLDSSGKVVVRKRCSRTQLLAYTANVCVQVIGMEARRGSHFLGRALRTQGHDVRLMPAQYVKPYVKTNKSDYIDAEAIAEAVRRPTMRFVPIKTEEHLDVRAVHRVRERWVKRRTAVVNQIRGLLLERGLTLPVRTRAAHGAYRADGHGDPANSQRERGLPTAHGHPGSRPGDCDSFGCCDRQWSQLSARKRPGGLGGNGSPRVFHGRQAEAARHVVALANKLLRMAWAVLCKNERYRVPLLATAP